MINFNLKILPVVIMVLSLGCTKDTDINILTEPNTNTNEEYLSGTCYITEITETKVIQGNGLDTTIFCIYPYKYDDQNRVEIRVINEQTLDSVIYDQGKIANIFRKTNEDIDYTYSFFYEGESIRYYTKFETLGSNNNWVTYTDSIFYEDDKIKEIKKSFNIFYGGTQYPETKWRELYMEYEDNNLVKLTTYEWSDNNGQPEIDQERYWYSDEVYSDFIAAKNPHYNSIFPDQLNTSLLYNLFKRYRLDQVGGVYSEIIANYNDDFSLNEFGYPDTGVQYFCE